MGILVWCLTETESISISLNSNVNVIHKHPHRHTHKQCLTKYLGTLWPRRWQIKLTITMGNQSSINLFLSNFYIFISLSCCTRLSRTSSTMWNRNDNIIFSDQRESFQFITDVNYDVYCSFFCRYTLTKLKKFIKRFSCE